MVEASQVLGERKYYYPAAVNVLRLDPRSLIDPVPADRVGLGPIILQPIEQLQAL